MSRAVGRVPSAGHGGGRPSLARPGDGRPVAASSAAPSVPLLLLPAEPQRRRSPGRPTSARKGVAAPTWSQPGPVTPLRSRGLRKEEARGHADQVMVGDKEAGRVGGRVRSGGRVQVQSRSRKGRDGAGDR